jgi:hypothetical protein
MVREWVLAKNLGVVWSRDVFSTTRRENGMPLPESDR